LRITIATLGYTKIIICAKIRENVSFRGIYHYAFLIIESRFP